MKQGAACLVLSEVRQQTTMDCVKLRKKSSSQQEKKRSNVVENSESELLIADRSQYLYAVVLALLDNIQKKCACMSNGLDRMCLMTSVEYSCVL